MMLIFGHRARICRTMRWHFFETSCAGVDVRGPQPAQADDLRDTYTADSSSARRTVEKRASCPCNGVSVRPSPARSRAGALPE